MVTLDEPGEGKGKGEDEGTVTVTFAGCGDAFGTGGRLQACIHIRRGDQAPVRVGQARHEPAHDGLTMSL